MFFKTSVKPFYLRELSTSFPPSPTENGHGKENGHVLFLHCLFFNCSYIMKVLHCLYQLAGVKLGNIDPQTNKRPLKQLLQVKNKEDIIKLWPERDFCELSSYVLMNTKSLNINKIISKSPSGHERNSNCRRSFLNFQIYSKMNIY